MSYINYFWAFLSLLEIIMYLFNFRAFSVFLSFTRNNHVFGSIRTKLLRLFRLEKAQKSSKISIRVWVLGSNSKSLNKKYSKILSYIWVLGFLVDLCISLHRITHLSTIWVVDYMKVSTIWRCRLNEGVDYMKVSTIWRCRLYEGVAYMKVSTIWRCRLYEGVDYLKLSTIW